MAGRHVAKHMLWASSCELGTGVSRQVMQQTLFCAGSQKWAIFQSCISGPTLVQSVIKQIWTCFNNYKRKAFVSCPAFTQQI